MVLPIPGLWWEAITTIKCLNHWPAATPPPCRLRLKLLVRILFNFDIWGMGGAREPPLAIAARKISGIPPQKKNSQVYYLGPLPQDWGLNIWFFWPKKDGYFQWENDQKIGCFSFFSFGPDPKESWSVFFSFSLQEPNGDNPLDGCPAPQWGGVPKKK